MTVDRQGRPGRRRVMRSGRRLAVLGAAAAFTVLLAQHTTTAAFTAQTGNGNTVGSATTFCTTPGSDTALLGEDSSTNGTSGSTTQTNPNGNLSVGTSPGGDGYGYIKFYDMDTVPSRCRILSATLTLYAGTSQAAPMLVYRAATTWTQASVNWSNQPAAAAGTPAPFNAPGGAGQQIFTVTQLVQDIVDTGVNHGFLVRDQASLAATRYQVYSSFENGTAANRPKLSFSWG